MEEAKKRLTRSQVAFLETAYQENPSPNIEDREKLAQKLKTTEYKIKIWFKNRRMRTKRNLEINQRTRSRVSPSQQVILEKFLAKFRDPDESQHQEVMAQTGLPKDIINRWFRNQRTRTKARKAMRTQKDSPNDESADEAIDVKSNDGSFDGDLDKSKQKWVRFSKDQIEILQNFYQKDIYPKRPEMEHIAMTVGDNVERVKGWFHYRRFRDNLKRRRSSVDSGVSSTHSTEDVELDERCDDSLDLEESYSDYQLPEVAYSVLDITGSQDDELMKDDNIYQFTDHFCSPENPCCAFPLYKVDSQIVSLQSENENCSSSESQCTTGLKIDFVLSSQNDPYEVYANINWL